VEKINSYRIIYVSGTVWEGQPACRIAVCNHAVDVDADYDLVKSILEEVLLKLKQESLGLP